MTSKAPVSAVRKIGAVAAVAATFAAPLLSAQALASPSTTPVVPTVPQHAQVKAPLPVNTPTTEAPAPPNATTHGPTIQAPTTKVPVTTVPATTQPAPTSHAPVTTSPVRPTTSAPVVTSSPTPSHSVVVTPTGSSPTVTSSVPRCDNYRAEWQVGCNRHQHPAYYWSRWAERCHHKGLDHCYCSGGHHSSWCPCVQGVSTSGQGGTCGGIQRRAAAAGARQLQRSGPGGGQGQCRP